ncbi:kinase-like domain-containing protein [Sphaerosporella brunnea]|uniref:non-specific serine/threonine protein kinase n=1 Tax=Sphaerosporella brunnea TaxID=1250544 RepID=A0A5J5EK49_9PEZI|nr:kinase-like domain-containing protein [Sphaerosporella brunnea]
MVCEQLYYPISSPGGSVEDVNRYCPGGYHPVYLGAVFNSRYVVLHKLGFGTFSTVWLARDHFTNRLVALKIGRAVYGSFMKAEGIQRLLGSGWLEQFEFRGPNGAHVCVVIEVMGPTLEVVMNMVKTLDPNGGMPDYMRMRMAISLARAVARMHLHGVVHGDIHGNNIVFHIPGMKNWTDHQVYEYFGVPRFSSPVRRLDGSQVVPRAPQSLVYAAATPLKILPLCFEHVDLRFIDFGGSFYCHRGYCVQKRLNTMLENAAPEVHLLDFVSSAVDIWAMACVFFRLFAGHSLFASNINELWTMADILASQNNPPNRWSRVLGYYYTRMEKSWKSFPPWFRQKPSLISRLLSVPRYSSWEWLVLMLTMLDLDPSARLDAESVVGRIPWIIADAVNGRRYVEEALYGCRCSLCTHRGKVSTAPELCVASGYSTAASGLRSAIISS